MELGLHLSNFTFSGGPSTLGADLVQLATTAEGGGFARLSVMDHFWQIAGVGPETDPMLEAYTTLGFLAAVTERIRLLALVTGAVYRDPGMLAKIVTTLDVLSGGRAGLGLGAAWHAAEARGLGLPFPPTAERFERLEEVLQVCLQMWSGSDTRYRGRHYQLDRTLNSPASLTSPHPPITIGGGGERKTLRLVARYADACNLAPGAELAHKLNVLRDHCVGEARDYETIEKTTTAPYDAAAGPGLLLDSLREQHELGVTVAFLTMPGPTPLEHVERLAADVIPEIAKWA
jgi:F420-dependent oxidoreductase-like protein